jgi:hypothetical protein
MIAKAITCLDNNGTKPCFDRSFLNFIKKKYLDGSIVVPIFREPQIRSQKLFLEIPEEVWEQNLAGVWWQLKPPVNRLNLKTSIFREPYALRSSFRHQRNFNFLANIFRVKFCNLTPKGKIGKMTPMGSNYNPYEREFHGDSKNIKIIFF